MRYRFGPYVADRVAYRVTRGDEALDLTPKLLDLLFYLLERPAALVTKEQLLDDVWADANVTENALAQAVSELREVLGDSPSAPTYIRTVARRGYRLISPVEIQAPAGPTTPSPGTQTAPAAVLPAAETAADVGTSAAARTVAVLDFDNMSGDADTAWLSAGIAETVTNDLASLDGFRVVDRWRVLQAARATDGSLQATGAALGAALLVIGSYQRQGPRLRITARLIDLERGEALADAKVDGALDDVFQIQDEIVGAFARDLGVRRTSAPGGAGTHDTANLEAYRAYIEGWLKLESLDTDLVGPATVDFERAIRLDADYAMAYTGFAHAQFVAYEMSRVSESPDVEALASGIEHARRAVQIDAHLAEAHATLSFLLVCAMEYDEARTAARRAVVLEPDSWRHQFRLGHACWGAARLRALDRALALFPQFPYSTLEAAMVHTARGQLDVAARAARQGSIDQDQRARLGFRYPAIGFHWLLGALDAAQGRHEPALRQFDREIAQADARKLYGPEYAAAAWTGRGYVLAGAGRVDEALDAFRRARGCVHGYARAHCGEAAALERAGRPAEAAEAWRAFEQACALLDRTRRPHEARLAEAGREALAGDVTAAATRLHALLDAAPVCHVGWTIPLEPALAPIRGSVEFRGVLTRLAERAN